MTTATSFYRFFAGLFFGALAGFFCSALIVGREVTLLQSLDVACIFGAVFGVLCAVFPRLSPKKAHLRMLLFSLCCSYLSAFIYLLVLQAFESFSHLPQHERVIFLLDPFVLTIAIPVATLIGLVGSVFAWIFLRQRSLLHCGAFILGCVTLVFILSRGSLFFCVIGGPLVAIFAAAFCQRSSIHFFQANEV
jgi:hypothetical protein